MSVLNSYRIRNRGGNRNFVIVRVKAATVDNIWQNSIIVCSIRWKIVLQGRHVLLQLPQNWSDAYLIE